MVCYFVVEDTKFCSCSCYSKRVRNIRETNSNDKRRVLTHGFFENIVHEQIVRLKDLVSAAPGQIVSKTLVQNKAVSVTLFAFAKGEEISSHDSEGDALVTVFEGVGRFTVNGVDHILKEGESIVMPATLPHAIQAVEDCKWMLTVVF